MYTYIQARSGLYVPHAAPNGMEVGTISAFSFGTRPDTPGPINEQLAVFALEQAEDRAVRIIAQSQVAEAIVAMGAANYLLHTSQPETPRENKYFSTAHMMKRVQEYGEPGTATLLVAQAHHAPRVSYMAAQAGIATELPLGLPDDFDPHSGQMATRSKEAWRNRERLVMSAEVAHSGLRKITRRFAK